MDPLPIPTEEEIRAAVRQGEEAVVIFFMGYVVKVMTMIQQLRERVQQLEDQLAKNSRNSGKLLSSDGLKKAPRTRSRRNRRRKKSGGQPGHEGHTLELRAEPDHVQVHTPLRCEHSHSDLTPVAPDGYERRQVFDLPPVQVGTPLPTRMTE